VQLMRDKDQFSYIAVIYNNLEDVILPVMQSDQVSDEAKHGLVSKLMPAMQKQAQGTRDTSTDTSRPRKNSVRRSLYGKVGSSLDSRPIRRTEASGRRYRAGR
jgi:hypothetical protein